MSTFLPAIFVNFTFSTTLSDEVIYIRGIPQPPPPPPRRKKRKKCTFFVSDMQSRLTYVSFEFQLLNQAEIESCCFRE